MPNTPFGSLQGKPSFDELVDYVVRLERKLNYVINGALDSDNIFEAGGWRITPDQLASKDQDVGMSTTDTGGDDVRFWAGGTDKDTAPWRVYKSGKGVATGWKIQSSNGTYPQIVIDPDGNLITAYLNADDYVTIVPDYSGLPAILFYRDGVLQGRIWSATDGRLNITGQDDLYLDANNGECRLDGFAGVSVFSWGLFNSRDSGNSLQDDLDSLSSAIAGKANAFSGYTGSVTAGTDTLHFSNGILTSVT